jgi:hypothetical protein
VARSHSNVLKFESSPLPGSAWVEVESPTVKVDRGGEV